MIEVRKVARPAGVDCWGRNEYEDVYMVTDNGSIIYTSTDDPTNLIKHLDKTLN